MSKFAFNCSLCKRELKRSEKFQVSLDKYDTETTLSGVEDEEDICKKCADKISRKIQSLRKSV